MARFQTLHQHGDAGERGAGPEGLAMASVQVRYIVRDVDAAIAFYLKLGFELQMHPAPAFAMLTRGELRLVLSAPNPSAGRNR